MKNITRDWQIGLVGNKMTVLFYTIHGKKITVKNVESINEAKTKLKKLGLQIDNIFKTDVNLKKEIL